ncbi:MAG: hemolysin family protein [Desulfovibrionaceae bacterium]
MDEGSDSRFWPFITRLFRARSEDPIEEAILEATEDGDLEAHEKIMLLNVLSLGEKLVEEIMVPRTDIMCAEVSATLDEIVLLHIESGHSRVPVFKGNRDNIVGIIHAKDLLKPLVAHDESLTMDQIMRTPFFIPETKNVLDLLQEFRTRKVHMAIALDEYGGTSGLVTIEDVLEEIVGDIEDEYDTPRPDDIQRLENGAALISGRAELEDVDEALGLTLQSEQVETLGGYLCELAGRVPVVGEQFALGSHVATVKEADAKQVRWILVRPAE